MATRPYKLSSNIPTVRLSNSRPFITQKAVLNSLHAQQIFERGYDMCANGLFSLTVVLRFIGTEEQAQAVEKMVDDLLDSTLTEIRQEIERMQELSEASGCETGIGYTNARTVEIQITSPRSIRFLAIIREFDQLIAAMDTLWLACLIDDTHYAIEAYQVETQDSSSSRSNSNPGHARHSGGPQEGNRGTCSGGKRVGGRQRVRNAKQ
jgi:hypothetical protein